MSHARKAATFIGFLIILLQLNSCKMARMNTFLEPVEMTFTRLTGTVRDFVADPYSNREFIPLTQSVATETLLNYRSKPVTAATGKRMLTLADCRALALANSLEIEKERIKVVSKKAVEYSNRTKLLPHVILSGELSQRDKLAFSFSEVLGQEGVNAEATASDDTGVTTYSTGRERQTFRYSLETRWSPTDAALAYYLTKTSRNETDRQRFVKIRVAQRLLGVVEASFQRLLSLQKAVPRGEKLLSIRKTVARKTENLFERKLASVEEYHDSVQKLTKAERLLASLCNETERQRNLLASALQLSPEYCIDGGFCLVGEIRVPDYREKICNMEMIAIKNRPEAYTSGLDHLSSTNDLKRTMIKYFPKVTGFWRYTRDKDKHQFRKDWKELGAEVYFDLVDWCSNVWERKAAKEETKKSYREIGVVALAITSEVRAAALKFYDALDQFKSTERSLASSEKVLMIMQRRASQDALKKLTVLEARGDVLGECIARIGAIGETQASLAELFSTMGINYNEPHMIK